jgi:hypothetical protein
MASFLSTIVPDRGGAVIRTTRAARFVNLIVAVCAPAVKHGRSTFV